MLTVLNYGGGNLKSVANLLDSIGCPYIVSDKPADIASAGKIIFPGQGHFGQVMNALTFNGLADPLRRAIARGVPFLGICVGLQVLFDSSEEAPNVAGLGVLRGKNVRFTRGKVPQIGWNKIDLTREDTCLTADYYYFVNSYHAVCGDPSVVCATADYHVPFTAAVKSGNVAATQFHPEKSGRAGRAAVSRWLEQPEIPPC